VSWVSPPCSGRQLSGRADVSDDYLQSLSPDTAVCRRESLLNPQDSDERRACFARRLVLIEAFLHHDPGDGKAARAAVTTGTTDYDPVSAPLAPSATASTPAPVMTAEDRAAWVRVLKADCQVRSDRNSTSAPMPRTWPQIRPCTTAACPLIRALAALRIRCRRRLLASDIGSASNMARIQAAEPPRVQATAVWVPRNGSGPAVHHRPARHRRDASVLASQRRLASFPRVSRAPRRSRRLPRAARWGSQRRC
jgi:hypothetical protein